MLRITAVVTLLLLATGAQAAQEPFAIDQGKFADQRARIEAAFVDGKRYGEIKPEDRERVLAALQRIQDRVGLQGNVKQLDESARVAVFNDQELINNLLTDAAADSRLICRREGSVGSHFKSNNCATVAERRRSAERAQQDMEALSRRQPSLHSN